MANIVQVNAGHGRVNADHGRVNADHGRVNADHGRDFHPLACHMT